MTNASLKTVISVLILLLLGSPISSYADRTLKIGVYLSMTGSVAAWGRVEWQGIETAHKIYPSVNGKPVKLILEDVASKPEGAALAAEKLVDRNIKFVVGPVASFAALAALPIFTKNNTVNVIPTANAKNLVKDVKIASRVCFDNNAQAKIMADYIYSSGKKRGVVVEDLTQDYSVDLTNSFISRFKKDGGKIEKIFYISGTDTDFSAIATQIKNIKPDFVYFTTYYNSIALMLRDLRTIDCKAAMFAGSAASSYALVKIAGKSAEGLIFTDDFDPLIPQTNISKKFIETFKKTYNRLPDSPEALAADAYLLLINAIKREGENAKKVANFVRNTNFRGVTGKIIIKDGVVTRTIVLREVKKSGFRPIAVFEP